jgi:SAM-dependent methyltransferase
MVSADAIVGLYDRNASAWDAARGRSLFEKPWLDRFLESVPQGGSILDIGCGAGEPIARHLVDRGYAVTGVDSSANLIDLCRQRMPDEDWRVADMRNLSLGRRFDGLIAWDSFFHLAFDDQRRMFPIFRAHAGQGASLIFTTGPEHGEALGTFAGETLYHASLSPEEYRGLLTENGFEVVAHRVNDPDCGGHTIWLARLNRR